MKENIRPYANAVWIALVNAVLARWDEIHPTAITYGELRETISGSSSGSQSMNRPLLYIYHQIKSYKEWSGSTVPLLNALVVGAKTGKPGNGIPESENVDFIWRSIRKKGKNWLKTFGEVSLGFSNKAEFKSILLLVDGSLEGDAGAQQPHNRVGGAVDPRHPFAILGVKKYLESNSAKFLSQKKVGQDFFVRFEGKKTVVEVKPEYSLQHAATAIGQLLLYGEKLGAESLVLAIPGMRVKNDKALLAILRKLKISVMLLTSTSPRNFEVEEFWRPTN